MNEGLVRMHETAMFGNQRAQCHLEQIARARKQLLGGSQVAMALHVFRGGNGYRSLYYDGNGMFLSLGNIASTSNVAMLFIDFQSPRRLRLQGTAEVISSGDPTRRFPGAQRLVRITAAQIFANCGRYIHRLDTVSLSPHLPDEGGHQPFPSWKRIDAIADSLPDADRAKVAQAGGPIAMDTYTGEESPDETTLV
ncbi:MAG: pyridoxamine 5'-phosphate oxidase family protein [Steroidobacteraceae bacterium]